MTGLALEADIERRLRPDRSAAAGSSLSYGGLTARDDEFDFR